MKKLELKFEDIVINTLIAASEKENRRIIDSLDIQSFKDHLEKKALDNGISLSYLPLDENSKNAEFLKQCIYEKKDDQNILYGIYPWLRSSCLYESRENLNLDLCILLSNLPTNKDQKVSYLISDRLVKDQKKLFKLEDIFVMSFIDSITEEWLTLYEEQSKKTTRLEDLDNNPELKAQYQKMKQKIYDIKINRKL